MSRAPSPRATSSQSRVPSPRITSSILSEMNRAPSPRMTSLQSGAPSPIATQSQSRVPSPRATPSISNEMNRAPSPRITQSISNEIKQNHLKKMKTWDEEPDMKKSFSMFKQEWLLEKDDYLLWHDDNVHITANDLELYDKIYNDNESEEIFGEQLDTDDIPQIQGQELYALVEDGWIKEIEKAKKKSKKSKKNQGRFNFITSEVKIENAILIPYNFACIILPVVSYYREMMMIEEDEKEPPAVIQCAVIPPTPHFMSMKQMNQDGVDYIREFAIANQKYDPPLAPKILMPNIGKKNFFPNKPQQKNEDHHKKIIMYKRDEYNRKLKELADWDKAMKHDPWLCPNVKLKQEVESLGMEFYGFSTDIEQDSLDEEDRQELEELGSKEHKQELDLLEAERKGTTRQMILTK